MRGLVVPDVEEDFTADPVELFFDLVFVFAFSQLVWRLIHEATWGGVGKAFLLFTLIWYVWSQFTWSANAVSGNSRPVRAIFLIAAAAAVPMAASVSTAFKNGGWIFGVSLGFILVMGLAMMALGLEPDSPVRHSLASYSVPIVAATAVLVVAGFLDGNVRITIWIIAAVVMGVGGLVTGSGNEWIVRAGHFSERHGLIVIIALGEIIVAIATPVVASLSKGEGFPDGSVPALAMAGLFAGLLWWGYFDRVLPALEHRVDQATGIDKGSFARDLFTLSHWPIVGGIIAAAAALEEITLHPGDPVHIEFRLMLVGGLLLYLFGVVFAVWRAYKVPAIERVIGAVVLTVLILALANLAGVWLLVIVNVILFVLLIAEHYRVEVNND